MHLVNLSKQPKMHVCVCEQGQLWWIDWKRIIEKNSASAEDGDCRQYAKIDWNSKLGTDLASEKLLQACNCKFEGNGR